MKARIARYTFTGDEQQLGREAEEGLLPIFQSLPGFKSYSVATSGNEIFSFSAWESQEDAEAAGEAAANWVAENMGDELTFAEGHVGEILFSTTLGVTTKSGATA